MDLKTAANLIRSEYAARQAQAEQSYRALMLASDELYEAEKAVRAAMLDGKNTEELAKLKNKRLSVIHSLGHDEKEFSPAPQCAVCNDSGYTASGFCECVRRRASKETHGKELPSFSFTDCDVSLFGKGVPMLESAYNTMKIFCTKFPETKNLNVLLFGSVGTGKTCLSSAVGNELEKRGFSVIFMTAFRFNDTCLKYHTSFDANRSDMLNALIDSDLLIIDDLGTESILKNVTLEYFYTVINERMNLGKHTLITTNLIPEQLEARYGERTYSRLFTQRVCLSVALQGKDLRTRK